MCVCVWGGVQADAGFVPLECGKGDLVLIHGAVDHLSLPNTSGVSRHTFQLHMVEGPGIRTLTSFFDHFDNISTISTISRAVSSSISTPHCAQCGMLYCVPMLIRY